MEVISLQSGSNGNSYYVKAGDREFIFDAGINGSVAEKRLAQHGRDIHRVEALFISHSHRDHSRSMGIFHRKYGHAVFVTRQTLEQARRDQKLGIITDIQNFSAGETIDFGDVQVHSIPTPHDAKDSVAFVIEHQGRRLGILTDIGHVFDGMVAILQQMDAVIIESNYDPTMLRESRYPIWLKRRVSGPGGHLSNEDAARALKKAGTHNFQWACLCHLSEENNDPEVALKTHRELLGTELPIHVASRYDTGPILKIQYDGPARSEWQVQPSQTRPAQLSLF